MFRILTVCTANICRSVMAATQLETMFAHMDVADSLSVGSRGVRAQDGYSACPIGFDFVELSVPAHESARLDLASVAEADFILTAEAQHRGAVVTMLPKARSRVFTMNEAAALTHWYLAQIRAGAPLPIPPATADPDERLRWWISELNDSRGAAPIADLDIGDPHMVVRGPDTHEVTTHNIAEAMTAVVSGFTFALSPR